MNSQSQLNSNLRRHSSLLARLFASVRELAARLLSSSGSRGLYL